MNRRQQSELQSKVDMAIITAHSGEYVEACKMLLYLGFSSDDVCRILNTPECRRYYINDYLTGF
jgi:hypothetical protein